MESQQILLKGSGVLKNTISQDNWPELPARFSDPESQHDGQWGTSDQQGDIAPLCNNEIDKTKGLEDVE